MLQNIRDNAQSVVAKVIVGLLVVSFSIWGIHSIIGSFNGAPAVAKVNGEEITQQKFEHVFQLQRQRTLAQMENPDPAAIDEGQLKKSVLDALIQEAVLVQDAHDKGLQLSDADVDALITSMPQFQSNGQFSQDALMATVRNLGLSVQEFRDLLRRQYLTSQVRNGIVNTAFVSDTQAKELMALQQQTRSFKTLLLPLTSVADKVSISDEEIQSYYKAHPSEFVQPESVDASYIELSVNDLLNQVDVSEQEMKDLYQRKMQDYQAHEERDAAHILIADQGSDKATQAKVEEVKKKLDAGADFGALAKQYSDDVSSAKNGGKLGYATRGTYAPAFDKALFSMKKGAVKGPVKTEYGYHFIKLLDVRTQPKPTFAEIKPQLKQELAKQKAQELFAQKSSTLADKAFSSYDLQEPAKDVGLKIQQLSGITRDGGPAPFDQPGLVQQLFSDDVLNNGNNTEMVHLGDDRVVVARVKEHHPESQKPLAAVQDQIRQKLKVEKGLKRLNEVAKQLVADAAQSKSVDAISVPPDTSWQSHENVSRAGSDADPSLLRKVFSMQRPQGQGMTLSTLDTDKGVQLIALTQVQVPADATSKDRLASLKQLLANQQGIKEYLDYQQYLQDHAEITRN